MNRPWNIILVGCMGAFLLSCGSAPKPRTEESILPYIHSEEFVRSEAKAVLAKKWSGTTENPETKQIETEWDVNLAPMGHTGRRHRLLVGIEGDPSRGYRVKATQESEVNTNAKNPLSLQEADWDEIESDGALALQFLFDLDRRLNPPKPWKSEDVR